MWLLHSSFLMLHSPHHFLPPSHLMQASSSTHQQTMDPSPVLNSETIQQYLMRWVCCWHWANHLALQSIIVTVRQSVLSTQQLGGCRATCPG